MKKQLSKEKLSKDSPAAAAKTDTSKADPAAEWDGDRAIDDVRWARMEISKLGFDALRKYQYQGSVPTPLDKIMNDFWWTPVVEAVPMWVAPNALTFTGLSLIIMSCSIVTIHDSTTCPGWAYALSAVSLFVYQTLDAIDGKQARRTKSSSALGQLFDHGCDSLTTSFLALQTSHALGYGPTWETFGLLLSVQVPFFVAQWQEYHTHVLPTSVGAFFGVTEAQLVLVFLLLVRAFTGLSVFSMVVMGYCVRSWILVALIVSSLATTGWALIETLPKAKQHGKLKESLMQLMPLAFLVLFSSFWSTDTNDNIFQRHPSMVANTLGLLFTNLTNQMIVCSLCRMPYPNFHWELGVLPALFVVDYFQLSPHHAEVALGVSTPTLTLTPTEKQGERGKRRMRSRVEKRGKWRRRREG